MAEFISESLVNQLKQYMQQKPAREPAVTRGHRLRDITGGRVNRYGRLGKSSKIKTRGIRNPVFASTPDGVYNATPVDYHISCTVIFGVIINLPVNTSAGAGKIIEIKDANGGAGGITPITVAPNGADTIDGVAAVLLIVIPFQTVRLMADGAGNWEVI